MLYKTVGQQAVQNRWPTTLYKTFGQQAVQNRWPTSWQNCWTTSCPKPVGQQAVQNLSANKLSQTRRPTSCLKSTPHGLQWHWGQSTIS